MQQMTMLAQDRVSADAATFCEMQLNGGDRRYLLPLLAHFSQDDNERWLTCIDSEGLEKGLASAANIHVDQMLCLRSNDRLPTTELMLRAMKSGRSHTVVGICPDGLSGEQRKALKRSAELAGCHCLVLTRPATAGAIASA